MMTDSDVTDLLAALNVLHREVIRLPFSGGVVRGAYSRGETPLETVQRATANLAAVREQYESFHSQREKDADDLARYRSLRGTIRHMLRDVT